MTFEFYGWIIEYYVFSISPGHGNSRRGRPESRGNAFKKVNNQRRTMRATSLGRKSKIEDGSTVEKDLGHRTAVADFLFSYQFEP